MCLEPPNRVLPTEEEIAYYDRKERNDSIAFVVFLVTATFILSAVATASNFLTRKLLKK